jgi:AraC-like DNA-binding protein
VEVSLRLLRESSRSVDSIARQLGYSDARSFRRFIKSATGLTPEALRAQSAPHAARKVPDTLLYDRIRQVSLRMSD